MLRFLSWQMRVREGAKGEVLDPSTLKEMQRVHFLNESWTSGRGLGFGITHTEERDLVGHGGSYPGYRTNTMLSPKERIGVPGRKWFNGFFSIGSTQKPLDRP